MGFVFVTAVVASLLITPLAIRAAWKWGAVSRPDGFRKRHAKPTPEWGGIAVSSAVLVGMGVYCILYPPPAGSFPLGALALSIGLLCALGCYDDLRDMRADLKLVGQFLSVMPLILAGCYVERLVMLGQTIELGWLGAPCTIAWIVLGINAMNLIDGMDGLASTIGLITAAAITTIAGLAGNLQIMAIGLVLAGALGGFLAYNLPPAKVYLGDCGSMVVGLVLATLALRAMPDAGTANATLLAALLFVPLCDTLLAVARRGLSGRGIMAADRGHVHHRLLDRGLGVWGCLAILGGLSAGAAVIGCMVIFTGQDYLAWPAAGMVIAICVRYELFGHEEWGLFKRVFLQHAWRESAPAGGESVTKLAGPADTALEISRMSPLMTKEIDCLPRAKTMVRFGTNARMAGSQSVSSASAGKKYVDLLG